MKLPVQKTERKKEPMTVETDLWPIPRNFADKLFSEGWFGPWLGRDKDFYRETEAWMPKVDITETDKEFRIVADLPSVNPEDIKVEVSGDNLVISGKSEEEKEEKDKTWHRIERHSGSFYREFELPKGADADKIEANCKNGTLTVKIQKKPEAQNKTIAVKSGE